MRAGRANKTISYKVSTFNTFFSRNLLLFAAFKVKSVACLFMEAFSTGA